jgi:hypothetical protein
MQIGRTLYYDNRTNIILQDAGEREGSVYQTDILEDLESFFQLSVIPLINLRCINLDFGADLEQALLEHNLSLPIVIQPSEEEIKQERIAQLQAELYSLQN